MSYFGTKNWLRPTFPGGCPPSIISDAGLNFCVRNGNRCISYSIATILIWMDVPSKLHANLKLRFFFLPGKFWSSPRSISTLKLNALLHLHLEPINQVVFLGSYPCGGKSYLEVGFVLRCLQHLSIPHIAIQLCHWRDNWCTRGASIPVLSY